MSEEGRIQGISGWYLKEQLDFDKRLIRFRYQSLRPHLRGPRGLEMGPAEGEMTGLLVNDFESLTVVEAAAELLERIPDAPNLTKVNSLFETYEPERKFNTIIMEHVLEHVEEPVGILRRARGWLTGDGRIIAGVPNGNSIHRLAAVKMGLLEQPCQLNARDVALGHRRVYTSDTLSADITDAGLKVVAEGGVFFKPLSNKQIEDHWTEDMMRGFYELGKDFPGYAAELYAVCEPR